MSDLLLFFAGLLVGGTAAMAATRPALRAARATSRLLEGQLTSAKHERQALQAEFAAAAERADLRSQEIAAENAELRARMDELADRLMSHPESRDGAAPDRPET